MLFVPKSALLKVGVIVLVVFTWEAYVEVKNLLNGKGGAEILIKPKTSKLKIKQMNVTAGIRS